MSRNRDALARAKRTGESYQTALNAIRSAHPDRPPRSTVVIACTSRAGGAGKTTITANLAAALAQAGAQMLAIDCDPQAHLRRSLTGRQAPPQTSRSKPWTPVDGITGSGRLAVAETPIEDIDARDEIRGLRTVLRAAHGLFDLVLLDPPPGPGAYTVSREADALLVPINRLDPVRTERVSAEHEQMFDWLDARFDEWLDDHDDEDSPDDPTNDYDASYEADRSAFLASVDTAAAARWPGIWPQQIPAWIERDDSPANSVSTRPATTEELIDDLIRHAPIGSQSLHSATATGARPHLLGFVLNRSQPALAQSPVHHALPQLTSEGVPIFRTWVSQSAEVEASSGSAPIVVTKPEALVAQQFHQLAAELRQRLTAWRPTSPA